jgi:hypothetical protein
MFNVYNDFENLTVRGGLYSVWIRASAAENAPLASVWIDPAMRAFQRRDEGQACAVETAPVEAEPVSAAVPAALRRNEREDPCTRSLELRRAAPEPSRQDIGESRERFPVGGRGR